VILNRQDCAQAMGVALPTFDKWVRDGCPVKTRGRKGIPWEFVLSDVIAWRMERERDNAAGSPDKADEKELARRRAVATTGLAELEFAKAKAEVAPVAEFERAQAKMMAAIRTNVMNVAQRAVLQLLGETDETTFKQRLRAELSLALEQSAQIDFDLDDEETDDEGEE